MRCKGKITSGRQMVNFVVIPLSFGGLLLLLASCSIFLPSVKEKLLAEHKAAWKEIWDTGRIDIEGDLEMAQAVYGSMYYILSSTRHDWPYGLSPGGLPGGEEYMGHTFWDQDIWMYPPLVLLHPDLARSSMRYRKNRLPAARRIAKEYGYKGEINILTIFA